METGPTLMQFLDSRPLAMWANESGEVSGEPRKRTWSLRRMMQTSQAGAYPPIYRVLKTRRLLQ